MSFSFLCKTIETFTNIRNNDDTRNNKLRSKNFLEQSGRQYIQTHPIKELSQFNDTLKLDNNTILDFKPPFVSTPKHTKVPHKTNSSRSSSIKNPSSSIQKRYKFTVQNNKNVNKQKLNRTISDKSQNKTMSAKFFNLINGSCTTLVKSFTNIRNIFKRKVNDTNVNIDNVEPTNSEPSCSYSFTEYMREKDMMEKINDNYERNTVDISNIECNTCNDTVILRQKLAKDVSLQKTVKRLKIGINMYGCDFKRISKKMWPRETYMTPSVLYNLYRKLLVK
ncbi:unnamed protein product [Danaus chrysippus]|uniref:(African queen) hypothetical protein n=1 Tax=Danaus chrysippus TaxID=151541 RepID=A0A8J2R181_9NEOP|nr:unnamed protein product [Danaus chrysippus]